MAATVAVETIGPKPGICRSCQRETSMAMGNSISLWTCAKPADLPALERWELSGHVVVLPFGRKCCRPGQIRTVNRDGKPDLMIAIFA